MSPWLRPECDPCFTFLFNIYVLLVVRINQIAFSKLPSDNECYTFLGIDTKSQSSIAPFTLLSLLTSVSQMSLFLIKSLFAFWFYLADVIIWTQEGQANLIFLRYSGWWRPWHFALPLTEHCGWQQRRQAERVPPGGFGGVGQRLLQVFDGHIEVSEVRRSRVVFSSSASCNSFPIKGSCILNIRLVLRSTSSKIKGKLHALYIFL